MGQVVISLDAELGWGFHDLEQPPTARVESGRRGWRTMLDLLDKFEVPATWAIVGHLMLDSCDGRHADHPASEAWFEHERAAWRDQPELRFAPDLVEGVLEADAGHEFASHSFSHVLFGAPETTRELADAELRLSVDLAAEWDQTVESFVYPRNSVGHRDVLAEHGVRAYRGLSPTPDGARGVLHSTLPGTDLLVDPYVDEHGLVNVPASMFLFGCEGHVRTVAESVWADPMVELARRGIEEAVNGDGVFHMWLHPNNLTDGRDRRRMRRVLEYLDRRRRETSLTVETMGEIASRVNPSPPPRNRFECETDAPNHETGLTNCETGRETTAFSQARD